MVIVIQLSRLWSFRNTEQKYRTEGGIGKKAMSLPHHPIPSAENPWKILPAKNWSK
jgi:hypothetical protein